MPVSMNDDQEVVAQMRRKEFQENGCCVLRQFLSPEQLAVLRDAYDGFIATPTKSTQYAKGLQNDASPKKGLREKLFVPALEACPQFAEVCKQVWETSERVWFLDAEFFKKVVSKKGPAIATPFHQDTAFQNWGGTHMAGFWMCFEDHTPKEYAFEVVRGSHKGPIYDNNMAFADYQAKDVAGAAALRDKAASKGKCPAPGRERLPEVNILRQTDDNFICSWELNAGDVVMFHPTCLHGGGCVDLEGHPERNTLVFRFFGDDVIYTTSHISDGGLYGDQTIRDLKEGDPYTKTVNKDGAWLRMLGPPHPRGGKEVPLAPSLGEAQQQFTSRL